MASSLDTRLGATAQRLIGKFGADITITAPNSSYNPATRKTTGTPTVVTVKATTGISRSRFIVAGAEVQAEKKLTVARADLPEGFVPKSGHKVRAGGRDYVVVGVDDATTGELVAAYDLHVRA